MGIARLLLLNADLPAETVKEPDVRNSRDALFPRPAIKRKKSYSDSWD